MGVLAVISELVEKWSLTVVSGLHICRFTDAVRPVFPVAWLSPSGCVGRQIGRTAWVSGENRGWSVVRVLLSGLVFDIVD